MLQSDFSYMIGPKMFKHFALPELQATCKRLGRSFYHLDGTGQIPHQSYLLGIEDLDGMQWVPGDGKPDCGNWPEVYKPIRAAGKLVQVINGGFHALDALRDQLGSLKGVHYRGYDLFEQQDKPHLRQELARFGITDY
jgi:5-methyltetrahydrofolate--homocysteine methyltransferase